MNGMPETLTLYFTDQPTEVPLKKVLSKALLNVVRPHIQALRMVGANEAFNAAVAKNPAAIKIIAEQTEKLAAEAKEAGKVTPEEVAAYVQGSVQEFLFESMPDIYTAVKSPQTKISLEVPQALAAVVEIVRSLVDAGQLSTEQLAMLNESPEVDGGFWDRQDLVLLRDVVQSFRAVL